MASTLLRRNCSMGSVGGTTMCKLPNDSGYSTAAAVNTTCVWCASTTQLLDGRYRRHDNLQTAIMITAAQEAAAAHVSYGWCA